jgi:hypothetical protein
MVSSGMMDGVEECRRLEVGLIVQEQQNRRYKRLMTLLCKVLRENPC